MDIRHEDDENLHWLDNLLDGDIPVLIGLEQAPQKNLPDLSEMGKKLYSKLLELTQVTPPLLAAQRPGAGTSCRGSKIPVFRYPPLWLGKGLPANKVASCVWVLGAFAGRAGRPVKAFLDALPAGLPVAFVYAQHIDPRFEQSLCKTIGRHPLTP